MDTEIFSSNLFTDQEVKEITSFFHRIFNKYLKDNDQMKFNNPDNSISGVFFHLQVTLSVIMSPDIPAGKHYRFFNSISSTDNELQFIYLYIQKKFNKVKFTEQDDEQVMGFINKKKEEIQMKREERYRSYRRYT